MALDGSMTRNSLLKVSRLGNMTSSRLLFLTAVEE